MPARKTSVHEPDRIIAPRDSGTEIVIDLDTIPFGPRIERTVKMRIGGEIFTARCPSQRFWNDVTAGKIDVERMLAEAFGDDADQVQEAMGDDYYGEYASGLLGALNAEFEKELEDLGSRIGRNFTEFDIEKARKSLTGS